MPKTGGVTAEKTSAKAVKELFKYIALDRIDRVKAELAAGTDPNVTLDPYGDGAQTALMFALSSEKPASAALLLDAGADVRARGARGVTALHVATDGALATRLLDLGADIDAMGEASTGTPLHAAARSKNVGVVELLLRRGATVDIANERGQTAYALASDYQVRALLREHGAKAFGPGGGRIVEPTVSSAKLGDIDVERGALGVDGRGRAWFGGYRGLFCLDGEHVTRFVFASGVAITGIARGKDVLCVATNQGLLTFDDERWTMYSSSDSELFDDHLTYITSAPDGRVYMLAYESEDSERHILVFDGTQLTVLVPGEDFPPRLQIRCLSFDANGELLIGTNDGFAHKQDDRWTVVRDFGDEGAFRARVGAIACDGDTLWIGTQSALFEHSRRDGKFVKHVTPGGVRRLWTHGPDLWVASGGLGRLSQGTFTLLPAPPECPGISVEDFAPAPDGTLWIRTGQREPLFVREGVIRTLASRDHAASDQAASNAEYGSSAVEAKDAAEAHETAPADAPGKPRRRRLVPFPVKALVSKAKLPEPVLELFRRSKLPKPFADDLLKLVRPAIAFDVERRADVPVGASKLGGKPDLPEDVRWPSFKGHRGRALPFLLQINLAETKGLDKEGLLPKRGMLYFFADTSSDEISDVRVLHTPFGNPKKLARRAFPDDLVDRKDMEDFVAQLPELAMRFFELHTLPGTALVRRHAELTDDHGDALATLRSKLVKLASKKLPSECSRLLGWPDSVQDEVVKDERTIALLQLNGYGLSPKKARDVFEHWCGDGLIHVTIARKALDEERFDRAKPAMAFT